LVATCTAEGILSIYHDGPIRQAETSQASAMAAYRVGNVDFQTLLSAYTSSGVLSGRVGWPLILALHPTSAAWLNLVAR
jgi:hypothetical protein